MLTLVRNTIEKYDMLQPSETVVVGVSGGADSLGLLFILKELEEFRLRLIVAHLNHGLRPKEADGDAEFVRGIALSLDLPFELKEINTLDYKKENNLSLEEAARTLRYRFLREVLNKYTAGKIATGHSLDDQAETVLMRFIRGSGLLGLSGIPPVKDNIVRPLIEVKRSDIENYLRSKGVRWIEDSTNKTKVFLRNRIRHDLMPELIKYNPNIKVTLARTGYIVGFEEDYIRAKANESIESVFEGFGNEGIIGNLSKYKELPVAIRFALIRLAIERLRGDLKRISLIHIISVNELILSKEPSGEVSLPDGIVVAKGYNQFIFTRKSIMESKFSYSINSTGLHEFPHVEFEVKIGKANSYTSERHVGCFDVSSVAFPIEIRNFQHGDRFMPYGMKTFKKLKSYFIDEKVPRFLRNRIPIFLTKGDIMWIGGMRVDERFKVKDKSMETLQITLVKPNF